MASPNDILNAAVEQTLSPSIDYQTRELSPIFRRIALDSSAVQPDWGNIYSTSGGTAWTVTRLFSSGLSGTISVGQMSPGSPSLTASQTTATASAANFNILGTGVQETWAGPAAGTSPAYFRYNIPLYKWSGNLHMTAELRRAERLDAAKMQIFEDTVNRHAENVALNLVNAFVAETLTCTMASGTLTLEGCSLAEIGASISGLTDGSSTATFANVTITAGAIARFRDGMGVDLFWVDSSADKIYRMNPSATPVFISAVDPLANTLTLVNTSASDLSITLATNDRIFLGIRGSLDNILTSTAGGANVTASYSGSAQTFFPQLPFNFERITKASGNLLGIGDCSVAQGSLVTASGGIALARFPRYKSYVQSVGTALDERKLFEYHARMKHAQFDCIPDQYIGSEGVISSITDNLDGLMTWERNGDDLSLNLGYADMIVFNAFGEKMRIVSDPFIGKGKLYGSQWSNANWKRHTPPRMPNSQSGRGFDKSIEFMGPATGYPDIWVPVHNASGQLTSQVQCPYWLPQQILPEKTCGVLLSSIVENYGPTG